MLTASRPLLAIVVFPLLLPAMVVADDPRSIFGSAAYDPPNCVGGEMFSDVDNLYPGCEFIEQIATDGVVLGCTPGPSGRFCPDDPVTRGQLATYLVRAMRGTDSWSGGPPVVRAISVPLTAFVDCESPGGYLPWIEEATGSKPRFLHVGFFGPVIEFDATPGQEDQSHSICTRLLVPPDYVAGSLPTLAAQVDVITPSTPQEQMWFFVTLYDGTLDLCAADLTTVGGVELETCTTDGVGLAPGAVFTLSIQVRAGSSGSETMNDGVQLYAIELRYLSSQ